MKRIAFSLVASFCLLSACGSDSSKTPAPAPAHSPPPPAAKSAESSKPPVEAAKTPTETPKASAETTNPPPASEKPTTEVDMDEAYKALMAKPEQPVQQIEIQHVLIGFKGAPRLVGVTRSKDEAKVLAQKVYAEAIGGADFDALVKQYTNDSAPGIYPLTQAGRAGMVRSFGDVGFRLKVGEIGVGVWDAQASPYGWHIIKRLK